MNLRDFSILIIDPDAGFRGALAGELQANGAQVSQATSGNRALELFPRMPFQLVLADAEMPNGSGPELIRELARRNLHLPVVLVAKGGTLDPISAKAAGAVDFLAKPLTGLAAAELIRRVLGGERKGFSYFLNLRRSVAVVSWMGELDVGSAHQLQECLAATLKGKPRYVILNLHGFKSYDSLLAGEIVKFQNELRAQIEFLVLCGLEPGVRGAMAKQGLVVEAEILTNLKEALQYILELGMK